MPRTQEEKQLARKALHRLRAAKAATYRELTEAVRQTAHAGDHLLTVLADTPTHQLPEPVRAALQQYAGAVTTRELLSDDYARLCEQDRRIVQHAATPEELQRIVDGD